MTWGFVEGRSRREVSQPKEFLYIETEGKPWEHPLGDIPKQGGQYTLKEGSVMQLRDGKNVLIKENLDVEIGLPSKDIERERMKGSHDISQFDPQYQTAIAEMDNNFFRDRRDVILNYEVIGWIYGTELYNSDAYPDD